MIGSQTCSRCGKRPPREASYCPRCGQTMSDAIGIPAALRSGRKRVTPTAVAATTPTLHSNESMHRRPQPVKSGGFFRSGGALVLLVFGFFGLRTVVNLSDNRHSPTFEQPNYQPTFRPTIPDYTERDFTPSHGPSMPSRVEFPRLQTPPLPDVKAIVPSPQRPQGGPFQTMPPRPLPPSAFSRELLVPDPRSPPVHPADRIGRILSGTRPTARPATRPATVPTKPATDVSAEPQADARPGAFEPPEPARTPTTRPFEPPVPVSAKRDDRVASAAEDTETTRPRSLLDGPRLPDPAAWNRSVATSGPTAESPPATQPTNTAGPRGTDRYPLPPKPTAPPRPEAPRRPVDR